MRSRTSSVVGEFRALIERLKRRLGLMTYDWEELDWSDTESLEEYARANMSEGYLSDSEDEFISSVFDELEDLRSEVDRLRSLENNVEEFIKSVEYYRVS